MEAQKIKNIIISDVDKDLISNINQNKNIYLKIEAKKNEIKKICDFLEQINSSIKVKIPFKYMVKKEFKKRKTFQGFNQSILNYVKREILLNVNKKDIVVDATVGNGNDTLFLANIAHQVIGFDIQEQAINNTREKVKKYHNVILNLESHENISKLEDDSLKLVLFNLGYLPGGNKNITTLKNTTLNALKESLKKINDKGCILVVIYPGHNEGNKEKIAILNYLAKNECNYEIKRNTDNPVAPFLVIIKKPFQKEKNTLK